MNTDIKTKLENLFKHKYNFFINEESPFNNKNIFQYTEIKKVKTTIKDFKDGLFPYIVYLQSLTKAKKNVRLDYIKSEYQISLFKQNNSDWVPEENCYGYRYFYDGINFQHKQNLSYDEVKQTNEYTFRIIVFVFHYYKSNHIKADMYKIDNCVICLNEPSTILYNPCNHLCVCTQCNKKRIKKLPLLSNKYRK